MATVNLTDRALRDTVEFVMNSVETSLTDYMMNSGDLEYLNTILDHTTVLNASIDPLTGGMANTDLIEQLRGRIEQHRGWAQ